MVYNICENEAIRHLWNENQGKRKTNKISTSIYKFWIKYCIKKSNILLKKISKPFWVNELIYKDFFDFKSKDIGHNFNKNNTIEQKVTNNDIK